MCGIAGSFSKYRLEDKLKKNTLNLMERRGPDFKQSLDFNYNNKLFTTLFHSRLSIIDLHDRSNQPFKFGTKSIVFNGEIYNYLEIKELLKQKNVNFLTNSDVEVLAKSIEYWGYDALDKLEGMWAFGIYDEEDGSLTLCRDRFGEKPLYVYEKSPQEIFFGSEIKFISEIIGKKFSVDEENLKNFMIYGYKQIYKNKSSFFKEITEIKPGFLRIYQLNKKAKNICYWQPSFEMKTISLERAISETREKLIDAVKIRLRSDVPLGFCMSGGIDSNSLISVAKRIFNYNVEGFTIINTDERYDEKEIIEQSAKELKIKHHKVFLDRKNFLSNLKNLVKHHDAPVYTITYYVHWLLMKAFKDNGFKISLSGTAADELFSGYYDHHNFYLASLYKSNKEKFKNALDFWKMTTQNIVRNPFLQNPKIFIETPENRNHITLGSDDFKKMISNTNEFLFTDKLYSKQILRNRMLNEIFHETVPVILHEDDCNAMYYSIENRSPFLDRRLFEFCSSIPDEHLVNNGVSKYILREAMRGIVPDIVINQKKKVGFNAPIEDLIDINDNQTLKKIMSDGPIWNIVNRELFRDFLINKNLPNSLSKFLFSFLTSKFFLEEYA